MPITRRAVLTGLAAALIPVHLQAAKRRNVLFLASDDLNHLLGCYGNKLIPTPNLDRLAARGVRFDRAYCQYPLCSPSRTSLMTGLGPDATQVYNLTTHFRDNRPNVVTLGQSFQKHGYFSARVGKIYHYGNPGQIGTSGLDDPPSWNAFFNPRGIDKDEEPKLNVLTPGRGIGSSLAYYASPAPAEAHTDGMVASQTISLLEENRQRPFFIAGGFYRPHCPYIAPGKYFDLIPEASVPDVPLEPWELTMAPSWAYSTKPTNFGLSPKACREARRAYYASIAFLDDQVGRVLQAVKRLGLESSTTITFWSDHGYQLGEHGQWMKQTLFETALRTPLIMAGEGVARGQACGRTVELLDLYPTLADLCGLDVGASALHGKSLTPLLRRPKAEWDKPAVSQIRWRPANPVNGYSIRTEAFRYTMWNDGSEGEELYAYGDRLIESKNLIGQAEHEGTKQRLKDRLQQIVKQRRAT
jgi:iduronate 2-sulfatase